MKSNIKLLNSRQETILEELDTYFDYVAVYPLKKDDSLKLKGITVTEEGKELLGLDEDVEISHIVVNNGVVELYENADDEKPFVFTNKIFSNKIDLPESEYVEAMKKDISFTNVIRKEDSVILEGISVKKPFKLSKVTEELNEDSEVSAIQFHSNGWVSVYKNGERAYTVTPALMTEDVWFPNIYPVLAPLDGQSTYQSMEAPCQVNANGETVINGTGFVERDRQADKFAIYKNFDNINTLLADCVPQLDRIIECLRNLSVREVEQVVSLLGPSLEHRVFKFILDNLEHPEEFIPSEFVPRV